MPTRLLHLLTGFAVFTVGFHGWFYGCFAVIKPDNIPQIEKQATKNSSGPGFLGSYSSHRGGRGIPTRLRHLLPGFVDFTVGFLAGVSRCSNQITYGRLGPR